MFIGIAQLLNVTIKKPGFNMFYISPYVQSPLAVFSMFWQKLGWLPNMLLYILAISIASAVVYYVFYLFRKIKKIYPILCFFSVLTHSVKKVYSPRHEKDSFI